MSDDTIDKDIDSLVSQLKQSTAVNKKLEKKAEEIGLNPSDVEEFVIKSSSKLVKRSLEAIDEVKDYIMASGDPDSISALSELIRASGGALESLNKIVVQNKRSATSILTKGMDIDSRKAIEYSKTDSNALLCTREEVFKKILEDANVIEITEIDSESSLDRQ